MAEPDSLRQVAHARTPFSTWFGVVLLFALFGLIAFAIIGPSSRTDTYESSRAKKRTENLKTLRDDAAKALTSYAWVDKTKGTARIPIERAMELTMADLKTKKPGPGGPIVTTPPAAGAQAPAASPAATASPAASGKGKGPASGTPKPTSVEGPESANRGQPAAATNPAKAPAGTQPGANAAPAGSAAPSTAAPAISPSPMANPPTSGSPLPVRGASASPSAPPH